MERTVDGAFSSVFKEVIMVCVTFCVTFCVMFHFDRGSESGSGSGRPGTVSSLMLEQHAQPSQNIVSSTARPSEEAQGLDDAEIIS